MKKGIDIDSIISIGESSMELKKRDLETLIDFVDFEIEDLIECSNIESNILVKDYYNAEIRRLRVLLKKLKFWLVHNGGIYERKI
ncbi:MAG: hypothetical protein J6M60_03550 [Clostridia bacterium]|nr:hypothetical protein [Clostridia bacterium]